MEAAQGAEVQQSVQEGAAPAASSGDNGAGGDACGLAGEGAEGLGEATQDSVDATALRVVSPPLPAATIKFFLSNRGVCAEWVRRCRHGMLALAVGVSSEAAVLWHAEHWLAALAHSFERDVAVCQRARRAVSAAHGTSSEHRRPSARSSVRPSCTPSRRAAQARWQPGALPLAAAWRAFVRSRLRQQSLHRGCWSRGRLVATLQRCAMLAASRGGRGGCSLLATACAAGRARLAACTARASPAVRRAARPQRACVHGTSSAGVGARHGAAAARRVGGGGAGVRAVHGACDGGAASHAAAASAATADEIAAAAAASVAATEARA